MALAPTFYSTGTATVAANGIAVTGQGTSWLNAVQQGDLFGTHKGIPIRIASVNSNTSLTLAFPWPGTAQTAAAYEIMLTPDAGRVMETTRQLLEVLNDGDLAAIAALTSAADKLAYFTGAGTAGLTDLKAKGRDIIAAADMKALIAKLGPIFGGPAPEPQNAEVDLTNGDLNTINYPGMYTIAGTWANGPSGTAGYTGLLRVEARSFNNLYAQTLTLSGGQIWFRFTAVSGGLSWPNPWTNILTGGPTTINGSSGAVGSALLNLVDGQTSTGDEPNIVFMFSRQGSATPALVQGNFSNNTAFIAGNNADLRMGKLLNGSLEEYMCVGSDGWIRIGTPTTLNHTSAGTGVSISNAGRMFRFVNGYNPFVQNRKQTAGVIQEFLFNDASVGTIAVNTGVTTYSTSSDYRLKIDVQPLVTFTLLDSQFDDLDDALLRIMAMHPVQFRWASDPQGGLKHGFIAHELQQVSPHAVTGEKDGTVRVGTARVPPYVIPGYTIPPRQIGVNDAGEPVWSEQIHVPDEVVPEEVIENVREDSLPDGAIFEPTGVIPVHQSVDSSIIVADLTAGLQSAVVMILEQRDLLAQQDAKIAALSVRLAALEGSSA